jgi:PAS domain-containing protein
VISQTTSQFAKARIDARALLGLYDPPDTTDWGPIRAAQLTAGSQLALFMLAANVLGAALVTLNFAHLVPLWQLASWGALVAAVGVAVAFRRLAVRHRVDRTASLNDVRHTVLDGLSLGAVWSIAPLLFGGRSDAESALGLWIVLVILMAASAVSMAALPMATIAFMGVLGSAIAIWLTLALSPALGAASLLFTALLIITCFARGKALIVIRTAEIAINERDETVSLLLREFEEKAADSLWETDSQRRIVRANPRLAVSLGVDPTAINGMPLLQILAGPAWDTGDFLPAFTNWPRS